ncbi:MAG: hypothetical protein CLLPBCKN_006406 [Chroococcidiopsis cubana SAG 39.79]|nr:hypothetical protein [Chroococcidiopsis cubana SAG 39.79]
MMNLFQFQNSISALPPLVQWRVWKHEFRWGFSLGVSRQEWFRLPGMVLEILPDHLDSFLHHPGENDQRFNKCDSCFQLCLCNQQHQIWRIVLLF